MIIGDIYEKWERLPDTILAVVENQLNGTVVELQDVELFRLIQAVQRDKATQFEMDKIQCVIQAALLAQVVSLRQVAEALGPEHAEEIVEQVQPIEEYLNQNAGPATKDSLTQGIAMVKWAMDAVWARLEELMNAPEPEQPEQQQAQHQQAEDEDVDQEPTEEPTDEDEDPHPRGRAPRRGRH
jgi:predicted HNH restriction endonuclease